MKLKRLIQHIPDLTVKGVKDLEITGLCANSHLVAPGNLFIAKKGTVHDGIRFVSDAIAAGAVAVLTDMADPFLPITQLIHPDVVSIEAKLAAEFYQFASHNLHVVGITGTNGKTTSAYLIKHLFDQTGHPAGLTGSIEWIVGDHRFRGETNTPDVITCHKLLKEMASAGCCSAVMEVTSHGLDQNRVGEIDFDIALFTNLTQDHLDYHKTMKHYADAKRLLFNNLKPGKWAILNADADFTVSTQARVMTYGIKNHADLIAKNLKLSDKGLQFTVCYEGQEMLCTSPLIGTFNVYNILGAFAVGLKSGIPLETCSAKLKNFKRIPGRLERVKNTHGFHIFIDFAHTEDALRNALETLRSIKKGKLITVFGCGGDRDREKREKMGRVVSQLSDEAIITNDNPRTEDPTTIAQDILKGIPSRFPYSVELDRKEAISKAIDRAEQGDVILIAGKGHEKEQICAHHIAPFDDVEIAKEKVNA